MVNSMTGAASAQSAAGDRDWALDIRSVNGRGLDIRFRLAELSDALEPAIRAAISKACKRGSFSVSLRQRKEVAGGTQRLNPATLDIRLKELAALTTAAEAAGLALNTPSQAEVLALPGVLEADQAADSDAQIVAEIKTALPEMMSALCAARASEGDALKGILTAQVDQIDTLTGQARALLPERAAEQATALQTKAEALMRDVANLDPGRLEQELSLITIKSDVSEELDRLVAHVGAAQDLLEQDGPVGRKLDFLTQEFNREANTLCSKANHIELSRIGLELKTVIDQMREQVQNVE